MATTTKEEPKRSLAAKLAAIGNEIGIVAKTGKNDQQKYDFIEYAVVSGKIRSILDKYKVSIMPQVDDYEVHEVTNKYGNVGYHYTLKMSFLIKDGESDEQYERKWLSEAVDYGDKSINKAETAGTKYFYMRLFNISEKGDKEADQDMPEMVKPNKTESVSAAEYKRLDFDEVKQGLAVLDDLYSVNKYAQDINNQYPHMTDNQRNAIKKIFDQKHKEYMK